MLTQGCETHHYQSVEEEQQHTDGGQVIEAARVFGIFGQSGLGDDQKMF